MRQFSRVWVTVVLAGFLFLVFVSTSDAAGVFGRKSFRANEDNNRNFVTIESDGQLETVLSLTTALTTQVDVRLDTIQDGPKLDFTVDLSKLTTGYSDRNSAVFSPTFLNLGAANNMSFRLIGFEKSKNWTLNNEQRIEVAGTGELTMGGKTKTVAIDVFLTYLQENDVTKGRLPGDLLHLVGNFNFRLSEFDIRIPQEALLKLNDLVRVHFDVFASSQ
jgi:polyisoprenoid-binding protein YceI